MTGARNLSGATCRQFVAQLEILRYETRLLSCPPSAPTAPAQPASIALALSVALFCLSPFTHAQSVSANTRPPSVGMEGRLELVLPERDLAVQAPDRHSPILLRIAFTRPHGTLTYYDLRYVGHVPGEYDLREFLFLPHGQPATNLEPILVRVSGILPTPHNGWLEEQTLRSPSLFGGYRGWMIAAAVLWAASLIPILRWGRRPKPNAPLPATTREPTFAERLRPLVERAVTGRLSADEKAALERMLINYWQRRLGLAEVDGEQLIARLREHPEARALLGALEDWLHRPPGRAPGNTEAQVESFLSRMSHELTCSASMASTGTTNPGPAPVDRLE